ncbi:MAG: polyprenyl synthetase family protein [Draconibacterium sp.]|nr:polyprenyl synthetase family protein [Draconibacterium sp.]
MKKIYSVEELQRIINTEINIRSEELKNDNPLNLYSPINYSLKIGGKRLRPALLLLSYNLFSDKIENALPSAVAIEVFHNFTLLHDDIMDKAEVRRNQPTVHVQYDENSAILSGDAMAFLSYKYLLEKKSEGLANVIELFSKTAIEVCEGQQYDMDFENRLDVTESEYMGMIRLKTAVLLACSLKTGALLANAGIEIANQLYEFGINIGLAFQLQDDLLDSFGNQKTFGKKIGGDILSNKKTYLLIKALETSSAVEKSELLNWIEKEDFIAEDKVAAILNIYNQLNIEELTQFKIDYYFQKSTSILQNLPVKSNNIIPLAKLSNQLLKRNY